VAQYIIYLAIAPFAFVGIVIALFLPRLLHSYQRFSWLTIFNLIQLDLVVNFAEVLVTDPALKQVLASIDYIFVGSWASTWVFFSLEYTGIMRRKSPWQLLFFALPLACCVCGIVNAGLIWRDFRFERLGRLLVMRNSGYGPLALVLFVQCYALMLAGAVVLLKHTVLSHALFRRQTVLMIAGVIIPTSFNLAFILKIVPGWTKDFSAPMAAMGGLCFTVGCLRYKLFSVVPVSRQTLFQHMQVGFVVTDADDRIVDLNIAACRILGKSDIALLGREAAPILKTARPSTRIVRHPMATAATDEPNGWYFELREGEAETPSQEPEGGGAAFSREQQTQFLSLGELRVVEMLAQNLSNKEIAGRLDLSVNTVKFHLSNAYAKTGTRNRAELVHRVADITNARAGSPPARDMAGS
jgi:DNA-binding CsgD family transcriptional regulator